VAGSVVAGVAALMADPAARHGGIAALVAVAFVTGALWSLVLRPWDRAKLAYGVTDQRVLIVHRGWRRTPKAYALSSMSPANIILGADSVGFADFAKRCGYNDDDICMPELVGLPDAGEVAQLIRAAVTATGGTPRWT
jgi:hypothetical protein